MITKNTDGSYNMLFKGDRLYVVSVTPSNFNAKYVGVINPLTYGFGSIVKTYTGLAKLAFSSIKKQIGDKESPRVITGSLFQEPTVLWRQ